MVDVVFPKLAFKAPQAKAWGGSLEGFVGMQSWSNQISAEFIAITVNGATADTDLLGLRGHGANYKRGDSGPLAKEENELSSK